MAGALASSIAATRIILLQHLSAEVDTELRNEVNEVAKVALSGTDPQTKQPFVDRGEALSAALAAAVPTKSQELLAITDGRVIARTPNRPIAALERDHQLVQRWASATAQTYGTIETAQGTVRYLAAPIPAGPTGSQKRTVFVAASFLRGDQANVNNTVGIAATVGVAALSVAIALAWLIAGRILAPVRALERAARSVTDSDLSYRLEVQGNDELARLALDFNAMLDRVETAFRSQRQFLDDAGHELRTPITVIRGHLELLGDDPAEREEVRGIIIDELDRMSRMVSDLLLLAQARRPDFLQRDRIDCATLTEEVQAKARALADRTWLDGGHADGWLLADRQRVTQAWMQLAQNAVQHTSAGDTIELGSRVSDQWFEFWVADSGPGIPAEDRKLIFDGFVRGEARRRSGQHFGLGLPIVRAIADAHGGAVEVGRSVHGGALFTLCLPAPNAGSGAP